MYRKINREMDEPENIREKKNITILIFRFFINSRNFFEVNRDGIFGTLCIRDKLWRRNADRHEGVDEVSCVECRK